MTLRKRVRGVRRWAVVLGAILLPALVVAQWQVNTQVNRGGGPSSGSVRYSSTYGYGNTIRNQSATMMLPSQQRYATWKSGALPSEVRMQARAVGPLAPSGSVAYIPTAPNYRTSTPTPGNYLDTRVPAGGATAFAGIPATPATGSVRYNAPSNLSGAPKASPWDSFQPSSLSGVPIGQALGSSSATGSVKFTP